MKKFILRILPIVLVAVLVLTTNTVSAITYGDLRNTMNDARSGNYTVEAANSLIYRVWSVVSTVIQVLAIAAIVFAGVKYMFAGADEKATIKTGMLILVIGAVLVFGATTVVKIIANSVNTF